MQHLGPEELFGEQPDLGAGEAGANMGRKALTVIASVLAGGDCIDDVGALRAAGCEAVLGHEGAATSCPSEAVAMDMWDPYVNSVRAHLADPDGKVVFDRLPYHGSHG